MTNNKLAKGSVWLGLILLLWPLSVRAQTTPLSDLDALRYIASHPDLIAAFGSDASKGRSHYEQWGINEGRKITFEPLNYTASHPDLMAAFGIDETKAVTHYIQWGFKEGRQVTFTPLQSLRYIASHADLITAFGADANDGVRHYIQRGFRDGRQITFEPSRYMASHSDLIQAFAGNELSATTHYIQWGFKEKRQTTFTDLDALQYIASHLDLIRAFGSDVLSGIRHYVSAGYREGRRIVFDALAYIASYADLISAFGTDALAGVKHYINWGYKEGRQVLFSASAYLAVPGNADVKAALGSNLQAATLHYINFGFREGRATSISQNLVGDSPGNPATDAIALKSARPTASSGLYWFDPDGAGGNPPFRTYADMTTNGGGWLQVRRIPGSGGWYPDDDNLSGVTARSADKATEVNSNSVWSLKYDYFVGPSTEFLFITGNGQSWCVLRKGSDVFGGLGPLGFFSDGFRFFYSTIVLASSGVDAAEGDLTTIVMRNRNREDPIISCQRRINGSQEFYREDSVFGAANSEFKNARGGVNIFVRTRANFAVSASHPARTATEIRRVDPTAPPGWYWFDTDGSGPNAPFQAFVDFSTEGGGWTQVRRIPGTGGWYPVDDNLSGMAVLRIASATESNSRNPWSHKFDYFVNEDSEFLFKTGDGSSWCTLERRNNFGSSADLSVRSSTVLGSAGVGISAGGLTNVLFRPAPLSIADPWIGCQGTHNDNMNAMLYGEDSIFGLEHSQFKNARNGINVSVRPPPTLPLIVNIDSVVNGTTSATGSSFSAGTSAIRVRLPAGTYEFVPVGPAAGALYTAAEFCNCNVSPRKYAFSYDYVTSENANRVRVQSTGGSMDGGASYSTAASALSGAPTQTVTLNSAGWVSFFIYDTVISDNLGGVSIKVQPIDTFQKSVGNGISARFIESFSNGFEQRWTTDAHAVTIAPDATNRNPNMPRFETLDGASVAILDNQLASRQSRYGFLSLSPVKATSFLEVRFNTLGIGSRDIDGLIEISVKSASDPSKFVLGRLHGGCFNGCKSIELQHSSLTGWQASSAIWEANTWYRLRLLLGARPEVQLWNDSKTKMLASVVSPTSTVGLGDTLYIGFSQRMDAPDKSHNLVVAVDSIEAQ